MFYYLVKVYVKEEKKLNDLELLKRLFILTGVLIATWVLIQIVSFNIREDFSYAPLVLSLIYVMWGLFSVYFEFVKPLYRRLLDEKNEVKNQGVISRFNFLFTVLSTLILFASNGGLFNAENVSQSITGGFFDQRNQTVNNQFNSSDIERADIHSTGQVDTTSY